MPLQRIEGVWRRVQDFDVLRSGRQNRWIAKSVDADGEGPAEAVDTYFVYQGNQIILQVDGEGAVTNRYLWGPAVDQILADEQVAADGTSEVLWTLTDHLNTVRDLAVFDAESGVTTIANHIVYDAFGRVTSQTDASRHDALRVHRAAVRCSHGAAKQSESVVRCGDGDVDQRGSDWVCGGGCEFVSVRRELADAVRGSERVSSATAKSQ